MSARGGESACALAGRLGVDPDALLTANGLDVSPDSPLRRGRLTIPANAGLRHRIQAGETLQAVARWYGLPVAALASSNDIADPDLVHEGSWLRIPRGARTGCPPGPRASDRALARPELRLSEEDWLPVDDLLAEARNRYDAADFGAVLELTQTARGAHALQADDPASVERRAHAIWLAGLAQAGLGRRDDAIASLREALALRPSLRDDPNLSPRILELLDGEANPRVEP